MNKRLFQSRFGRAALCCAASLASLWCLAPPNQALAAGDPEFETAFEWEEVAAIRGERVRVRGELVRDLKTGREFTDYLSLDGEPLPAEFILGRQKNWNGPPATVQGAMSPPRAPEKLPPPVSVAEKIAVSKARSAAASLGPVDEAALRAEDARNASDWSAPARSGVVRALPSPVSVTPGNARDGGWVPTSGGGHVWLMEFSLEGAKRIRVHLENAVLPAGTEISLYNPEDAEDRAGPYGSSRPREGELWTGSVFSSRAVLEIHVPAGADPAEVGFSILEVGHIYRDLAELDPARGVGACHNDVTCRTDWATQASGVSRFEFASGGSFFVCSGALINDVNSTLTPYYMTAYHCVSTQAEANSTEFFWFYETTSCNGAVPSLSSVPRTSGAEFLAGSASFLNGGNGNDFSFLLLDQNAPGGTFFMGWTTSPLSINESVTGIHHPRGTFKRISFGRKATFFNDPNLWEADWNATGGGATEPGSSGSPLYNTGRLFVGQLCCGEDVEDPCTQNTGVPDQYGKFSITQPVIASFLAAPACGFTVSPEAQTLSASNPQPAPFVVDAAAPSCDWTSSESASWIAIASGQSGTGDGQTTISVANNTGDARATLVNVAGQGRFVTQNAGNGSLSLLTNISTRGRVGTGGEIMIAGFVVSGQSQKTVLITGRGPGLADFGVPNTLANPQLALFRGSQQIGSNDNWTNASNASAIMATGLAPTRSAEAAMLVPLDPGPYTVHLSGVSNGQGNALVEVWETVRESGRRLSNISTRGRVGQGDEIMIAGFIVEDTDGAGRAKTVMIRALGPVLADFGLTGVLSDPTLRLFDANAAVLAENDDWQNRAGGSAEVTRIQNTGLAPTNSLESVIVQTLAPGAYTVHLAGFQGATGNALIEVWEVE